MLYRVDIPNEIAFDEDTLCERLYSFLRRYINKRLIYESEASKEDWVQDTIMFLLKRFNKLTDEEKRTINLERFFYNRANSYIGGKLRREKTRGRIFRDYAEEWTYLNSGSRNRSVYLNEKLLVSIVETYDLGVEDSKVLVGLANNKLVTLGYVGDIQEIDEEEVDPNGTLDILSYSVVDEYLVRKTKGGGNYRKQTE